MDQKTENQWPLQFEVIEETKQVGRWSAPSWHIGDIHLYEKKHKQRKVTASCLSVISKYS